MDGAQRRLRPDSRRPAVGPGPHRRGDDPCEDDLPGHAALPCRVPRRTGRRPARQPPALCHAERVRLRARPRLRRHVVLVPSEPARAEQPPARHPVRPRDAGRRRGARRGAHRQRIVAAGLPRQRRAGRPSGRSGPGHRRVAPDGELLPDRRRPGGARRPHHRLLHPGRGRRDRGRGHRQRRHQRDRPEAIRCEPGGQRARILPPGPAPLLARVRRAG